MTGSPQVSAVASRNLAVTAVLLFMIACASWTWATQRFGSNWIKTGSAYSVNALLGYSETERGSVVHKENRSFLQQISMFAGATTDVVDKGYVVRPSYAYTAAFLAPIFGIEGAALVLNILAWAVAGYCAWSLAVRLFNDQLAGLFSVGFVATGMGFVVHVADLSAHLLSFTTYYLGIVVLERSEVWKAPGRERHVHLAIGTFLGLCSLTYNTGLALSLGYVLLSVRHNRWIDVAIAAAIAWGAQYAWTGLLNLGYVIKTGDWGWYNLYANESDYLRESLRRWISAGGDPVRGVPTAIAIAAEFLCFEFPLTVLLGLGAIVVHLSRERTRWLALLVLFVAPIGGAMAYAQEAAARGYLVFGISLIVYVALGGLIAAGFRGTRTHCVSAVIVVAVLLGGQIVWSSAAFTGRLGPLRTYYRGFEAGIPAFSSAPLVAVSLTAHEPSLAWFGGTSPFADLGIYQGGGPVETAATFPRRLLTSLASRALITSYVIFLLVILVRAWDWNVWRTILCAFVFIYLLPSVVMAVAVRDTIHFVPIDTSGPGQTCRAMQYSVQLSDDFWRRLVTLADGGMGLELFFRPGNDDAWPRRNVEFAVGDQRLTVEPTSDPGRWSVTTDFRSLPKRAPVLRVTYRDEQGIRYLGWQRAGLPGRTLRLEECNQPTTAVSLPALELRAGPPGGIPTLVGF